ncbi:hypothetical protein C9412_17130 [Stenotrophomonas sp. Nf1]|nr:hypothetical protein C9412_17130 [Stenotrophomonas sp. Nf1]PTA77379.1 hypothetical protein C9416_15905 [Stenotrophomonas sp. Nf4]
MANTFVDTCPHCRTESVGMSYVVTSAPRGKDPTVVFRCNACNDLVCVATKHGAFDHSWITQSHGEFRAECKARGAVITGIYPTPKRIEVPEHISAAVQRAYMQGSDNAARGHADAAAAMYRKALDVATRELDSSLAGKNLAPRIDALHKAGKLTDDLKEWAHLIRLDGNQGAHDDDELSSEEIFQLASFTELFLTYTFTLPAQVAARKAAAALSSG